MVNQIAYLTGGDSTIGLDLIDVKNPKLPTLITEFQTANTYGIAVSNGYAYVGSGYNGIKIIDIRQANAPRLSSFYNTPGMAYRLAVSNGKTYIADRQGGLQVLDTTQPEVPVFLGAMSTPGQAWDVAVKQNAAFVADSEGGLLVVRTANLPQ